jgi:hypothetical protein
LTKAAKRQRVQHALERFLAGQANESDFAVFRDRHVMYCATADQACRFIEAAAGQSVPFDVFYIWSNILRYRWLQSLSGRRSGGALLSRDVVEVPAAYEFEEEDEQ